MINLRNLRDDLNRKDIICTDYTKIENYEEAVNDTTQTWHCHHRLETHFSDGTERPKDAQITAEELIALGIFYNRPLEELIFLTNSEHAKLHGFINRKDTTGTHLSEETKRKISESEKGKDCGFSDEHREYLRQKMIERNKSNCPVKGKHWKLVDGKRVYY